MAEVTVRPATHDDVAAAVDVQMAAFDDLDRRNHEPEHHWTEVQIERSHQRHHHFIEHDPAGSWVAVLGDRIVGTGLALRRDTLWGLSLLVVDPSAQSLGVGRRLIDATLTYAEGCDRGIILSSNDVRAMRTYATSGFSLYPQVAATGKPSLDAAPASLSRVREGSPADRGLADALDRQVRGAGRGPDHALISEFAPMYVVDDADGRGYAYLRDREIYLLAATDDDSATALLWRCFAHAAEHGNEANIEHITGEQQWAIKAALDAKLALRPNGPVFWRGITPPRSYIPSGAYL